MHSLPEGVSALTQPRGPSHPDSHKESAVSKRLSSRAANRPLVPPHLAVTQAVRWTGRAPGAVNTPTCQPIVMDPKAGEAKAVWYHYVSDVG